MIGVREYAEGYEVRIGRIEAGETITVNEGHDARKIPEGRDVIIAYNEASHNSVAIDVQDLVAWLLANRPDLFAQSHSVHVYGQRVTEPLDRCLHCGELEDSPLHQVKS